MLFMSNSSSRFGCEFHVNGGGRVLHQHAHRIIVGHSEADAEKPVGINVSAAPKTTR